MHHTSRAIAVATMVAVAFHGSLSTLAAPEATIEGTVSVPCDPSRVGEVALLQVRSVSDGSFETIVVDSSTGTFRSSTLTAGEYEVVAIGADGQPFSPEPMTLLVREGSNAVVLTMQPPGCGEPDSDLDGVPDTLDSCPDTPSGTAVGADGCPSPDGKTPGKKSLKDWQLSLIYVGVVGAVILALDDDNERRGSPSQP